MLARLAMLFLVLSTMFAGVYAANESVTTTTVITNPSTSYNGQNPAVAAQVEQSNRYLSAELQKQLKDMKTDMLQELKDNQDSNTALLYQWMKDETETTRQRVVIGTLGACALIQAVLGFVYLWINRRYSYEYFLEKELKAKHDSIQKAEDERFAVADLPQNQGIANMQQTEWHEQVPQQTVSMEFGQEAASQMTAMNEWQFQAPHESGWKRQEEPVSKVKWEAIHAPVTNEGYEPYDTQGFPQPQQDNNEADGPWRRY